MKQLIILLLLSTAIYSQDKTPIDSVEVYTPDKKKYLKTFYTKQSYEKAKKEYIYEWGMDCIYVRYYLKGKKPSNYFICKPKKKQLSETI